MSTGKASGRSSGTASEGTNTSGLRSRRPVGLAAGCSFGGRLLAGVAAPAGLPVGETVDEAVDDPVAAGAGAAAGAAVAPEDCAAVTVVAPAARSACAASALVALNHAINAPSSSRDRTGWRLAQAGMGLCNMNRYSAKRAMRKPTSARRSLPKSLNARRSSVAVPCSQVEPLMTWNCPDPGPSGFAARVPAGTS